MDHIFIGRQPILDREGSLYAYELLHRQAGNVADIERDGDRLSSEMLLNAALEVGSERISASRPAFINVTRNLLLNGCLDSIPSSRIGLEVLESVTVDEELLDRLRGLRRRGFTIALDDFVWLPERVPLIAHADIVKLDVLALDDSALARHVNLLEPFGVKLLAEKVETAAMHARALDLGFDLFQGYFFARPEIYRGQKIRPNHLVLVRLLARVHDPAIDNEELSGIIKGDVSMSVTVLRWANSPLHGLEQAVQSVERAVVVLGLQTIRNWVSLLVLARVGTTATELHTTILVRARTCELLAATIGVADTSSYFTVGLFSALDVILRVPMAQALEHMPLGADQSEALLQQSGQLGAALKCVMAMESGDEAAARFATLDISAISRCYFAAVAWIEHLGQIAAAA